VSRTFARFRAVTTLARHGLASVVLALAVASCQKAPADVREWSPKDHTNTSNKPAEQTGQVNANPAPTETPPKGLDPVTLAAWGSQCSSCHGKIGKGDGPNGKMVKATDLSNPDWQAQITDEQIVASITTGKNAMPAFSNLPKDTVENLMWLVRWFNSDQTAVQARMDRLKAPPAGITTSIRPAGDAPKKGPPAPTAPGR
jgi:mono/diheme cytochrome c family protein